MNTGHYVLVVALLVSACAVRPPYTAPTVAPASLNAGDPSLVVQQPFEFGYQAMLRMAQAVRGDTSFIPESKQIIVPTLVVNRANVEDFTKRINELRGR